MVRRATLGGRRRRMRSPGSLQVPDPQCPPLTLWWCPAGRGGHQSLSEEASFQPRPDSCGQGSASACLRSLRQKKQGVCKYRQNREPKDSRDGLVGAHLYGPACRTGRRELGGAGRAAVGIHSEPSITGIFPAFVHLLPEDPSAFMS